MNQNFRIGNLVIDSAAPESARNFYADFLGCEKIVSSDCFALKTNFGMNILFAKTELSYAATDSLSPCSTRPDIRFVCIAQNKTLSPNLQLTS